MDTRLFNFKHEWRLFNSDGTKRSDPIIKKRGVGVTRKSHAVDKKHQKRSKLSRRINRGKKFNHN